MWQNNETTKITTTTSTVSAATANQNRFRLWVASAYRKWNTSKTKYIYIDLDATHAFIWVNFFNNKKKEREKKKNKPTLFFPLFFGMNNNSLSFVIRRTKFQTFPNFQVICLICFFKIRYKQENQSQSEWTAIAALNKSTKWFSSATHFPPSMSKIRPLFSRHINIGKNDLEM